MPAIPTTNFATATLTDSSGLFHAADFVFQQPIKDTEQRQQQSVWCTIPVNQQTTDQQLITAIGQSNTGALGRLYDLYAGKMLGLAYRVLGNRRDAEDLIHDVFCEVWNKATSYDSQRGSVQSWLLLRTRSRALDRLRKLQTARKYALLTMHENNLAAQPKSSGETDADHQRAVLAINNLPLPQRQVIELKYYRGLSLAEIAERCATPIGTVKSRLSAALRKLRNELGPGELHDAKI